MTIHDPKDLQIDAQQTPYQRTHGISHTPEYRAWSSMRRRCYDPANAAYADYGGRGITVCERWLESPLNFLADMGPKPSARHCLDRTDNSLGYFKENCRWVTYKDSNQNKRSNRWIVYQGRSLPLIEWIRQLGLSESRVANRLYAGWSVERAFTEPAAVRPPARHCVECGVRCRGQLRCQTCENRTRPKRKAQQNDIPDPPDPSIEQR